MKSNHVKPEKLGDGSWSCSVCGAESMDQELFEVLAAENECVKLAIKHGEVEDPNDGLPWDSIRSARQSIEKMKGIQ